MCGRLGSGRRRLGFDPRMISNFYFCISAKWADENPRPSAAAGKIANASKLPNRFDNIGDPILAMGDFCSAIPESRHFIPRTVASSDFP
jgi:hypothetical protein